MKSPAFALAFLLAFPVLAQSTIHVPADVPTIQAGIDLAKDGDTVLVAPGTYVESIFFLGKAIAVRSSGGASATTIQAVPNFPCVNFHAGEGSASLLEGFTVTGARSTFSGILGGGVSCLDTTVGTVGAPTIRGCAIVNNSTANSPGGGVFGNATLEDCLIAGNSALSNQNSGGGVFGIPILRRCVVSGNSGYDGGGVYVSGPGALIEDSTFLQNIASEGTKGAGVHFDSGQGTLRRCLIAGNQSYGSPMFQSQGAGVYVFSAGAPLCIERCTIVANEIPIPSAFGPSTGGVHGNARLVDCIVGMNDEDELGPAVTASYSDIEGGLAGTGNISADPLFVDPASLDFHLLPGSPCIDAGDPASAPDPDCTRADMGALYFAQALAFQRHGLGINDACFASLSAPAIGTTWLAQVDASLHPGATFTGFLGSDAALVPGVVLAIGEVLIAPGGIQYRTVRPSSGGLDVFSLPIPADPAFVGQVAYLQAFIAGNGIELCNALDVKVGN